MSRGTRQLALITTGIGRWRETRHPIAPRIHALRVHRVVWHSLLRSRVLPADRLRQGCTIVTTPGVCKAAAAPALNQSNATARLTHREARLQQQFRPTADGAVEPKVNSLSTGYDRGSTPDGYPTPTPPVATHRRHRAPYHPERRSCQTRAGVSGRRCGFGRAVEVDGFSAADFCSVIVSDCRGWRGLNGKRAPDLLLLIDPCRSDTFRRRT